MIATLVLVGACQTTSEKTIPISLGQAKLAFDDGANIPATSATCFNYSSAQVQVESYSWKGGRINYVEAFPGRLFRVNFSNEAGLRSVLEHQLKRMNISVDAAAVAFSQNRIGRFPYALGHNSAGDDCFVFSQTIEFTMDDGPGGATPSRVFTYGAHCAAPAALGRDKLKAGMLAVAESIRENR